MQSNNKNNLNEDKNESERIKWSVNIYPEMREDIREYCFAHDITITQYTDFRLNPIWSAPSDFAEVRKIDVLVEKIIVQKIETALQKRLAKLIKDAENL